MNFVAVALMAAVGFLMELDGVPPHKECYANWQSARDFHSDLVKNLAWEDRWADAAREQLRLAEFWGHLSDATWSALAPEYRFEHAIQAREIYDWHCYGLPPVWAYWRLPVYQGR